MHIFQQSVLIISLLFLSLSTWSAPPEKQIESLVFTCYTCHGTDGESPGEIPKLKGKTPEKIEEKLLQFRQDQGDPTIMNRIAKGYTEDEIKRIAEYLGGLQ